MNKATENTETKIFQFPTNKETYDSYTNEHPSDKDISFENNSISVNDDDDEDESFENINAAILQQLDEHNKSKGKTGTNNALVPVDNKSKSNTNTSKGNTTNKSNTNSTSTKSSYSYHKTNYNYKGTKNNTIFKEFVRWCLPLQLELKYLLVRELITAGYTDVIQSDGFIYAKGTIPILLTAHMDTVHIKSIEDFYEYYDETKNQHILSSPQGIGGDDRCGIYMILQIIKTHKCSVLFCEDEESGGIGSGKFVKTEFLKELKDLKYMIELDRMNSTDAVFYRCDNPEFTKFIVDNTGYKESWGSFSDISTLAPAAGVAAVNLSCGYHNAHSTSEYVVVEEMLNTINVVKKLLDVECEQFKYIAKSYSYGNYGRNSYYHGYGWDDDYDDYDDYYGGYYGYYGSGSKKKETKKSKVTLFIYLNEESVEEPGCLKSYVATGCSIEEAFGKFFMEEMSYCYTDVYDYDVFEDDYGENGWLYQ